VQYKPEAQVLMLRNYKPDAQVLMLRNYKPDKRVISCTSLTSFEVAPFQSRSDEMP
jgi:hypothetical protein